MAVTPRLAFALVFVLNCILWTQSSRYDQPPLHRLSPASLALRPALLKRGELGGAPVGHLGLDAFRTEKECRPFAVPLKDQCAHVEEFCTPSQTVLAIPYLRSYFCSSAPARPFVFAGLLVWLTLVFSTLGISASDFFCPNLATIAHLLGLDENVAGVTFLAFGNGSPDVFSTFSAMRANSGSLAIGELLGAASFIVSVVVGSMCIIKPFKIRPGPFLRDIGFFTVAVAALFAILIDGNVHTWEALLLVALYVAYVVVVVVGTWWERRRERRRFLDAQIRSEYADDDSPDPTIFSEPYRDEPETIPTPPTFLHLPSPQGGRRRAISHPGQPTLGLQTTDLPPPRSLSRSHSRNNSLSPSLTHLPSFSLVGALEFREVIASLQSQAAGTALHSFESTPVSYPGGHYHRMGSHSHSHNHTPSGHGGMDEEFNPFDFSLNVPLNGRALPPDPNQTFTAEPEESTPLISVTDSDRDRIPAISHTPPSPTPDAESPPPRRQRILRAVRRALHVLFPTFHGFREKSLVGKVASTFAAPSVFLLTLTLPVVVMAYDGGHAHHEKPTPAAADALVSLGSPLVPLDEQTTVERAEEEVSAEMHHLAFDRWLMAAQCTFGPLFMTVVLFKNAPYLPWLLLGTGLSGLALGALVISFATDGEHPAPRLARCLMGFTIAIVWVMAIADEVVTVLQTFGFIFGLSDAIIGLTVFAVGNSLADLVANMSVAVFAPVMGFSACFGGPMLNMLLGVGIAGSYVTSQTGVPYELDFSRTLVVSSLGLLVLLLMTAVFVPLNGYYLPRAWGVFLIVAYAVIMSVNVVVEVLSG